MRSHFRAQSSRRVIALLLGCCLMARPVQAQGPRPDLVDIVSPNPPSEFGSPEDAMAEFKAVVSASDLDKLAALLGVNADRLKATEGVEDTLALIKEGVARRIGLETQDDQSIIDVGFIMWPFPFPIVKKENGKFAFDPVTGIEEIINRRIGENEIQAIETLRGYVDAQEDYALDDHDGDGVLEYAQKLVSTEGQADGLYWPLSEGLGPSPAGPLRAPHRCCRSRGAGARPRRARPRAAPPISRRCPSCADRRARRAHRGRSPSRGRSAARRSPARSSGNRPGARSARGTAPA